MLPVFLLSPFSLSLSPVHRSSYPPPPKKKKIMVNGTDAKFLSKVQQMHGNHKHYIMPKRNNCPDPDTRNCFGVVHFAGDVFYNVRDFVEKNKVGAGSFVAVFDLFLSCLVLWSGFVGFRPRGVVVALRCTRVM